MRTDACYFKKISVRISFTLIKRFIDSVLIKSYYKTLYEKKIAASKASQTKAFFTNTEATTQTLEPLKGNLAFYQTNKLLEKFDDWKIKLKTFLQP